jgi:hypothetical protein
MNHLGELAELYSKLALLVSALRSEECSPPVVDAEREGAFDILVSSLLDQVTDRFARPSSIGICGSMS